jgi:predicted nucleic acid-binding protein
MDSNHDHHRACTEALDYWSQQDDLCVSVVTWAELAAGGRTREALEAELEPFTTLDLDLESAWLAGQVFGRYKPAKAETDPALPDFFIRAQAERLGIRHLTNDRRRRKAFPNVEWLLVES